ncbi:hypothetical protein EG68_04501 [Paragonimus skrjabini miyazakii]|uniref:Tetraspanin n=1 Tax=Paragonimus skrjabini miyazakii TaxID=59628 RepID=A0A8S9YTX1_9TREM|nr:hypothetical protein EG68_04501 [Paragonimus skrjabini miyazakii]
MLLWANEYALFEYITQTSYYTSGRILLLTTSLLAASSALFGCCIINTESSKLLLTHTVLITFLLAMSFGTTVCGFYLLNEVRFDLHKSLTTGITKYYGINQFVERNIQLTHVIDEIQLTFRCCGVSGERNSETSWYMYRNQSSWYYIKNENVTTDSPPFVPESCCAYDSEWNNLRALEEAKTNFGNILDREACVGLKKLSSNEIIAPRAVMPRNVTRTNRYLHERGCLTVVYSDFKHYALLLAGFGLGGCIFMLIGFVLSSLLLWRIEYEQFLRITKLQDSDHKTRCHFTETSGFNSVELGSREQMQSNDGEVNLNYTI